MSSTNSEVINFYPVAQSTVPGEVLNLRTVVESDGEIGLVDEILMDVVKVSRLLASADENVEIQMTASLSQTSLEDGESAKIVEFSISAL